MKTYFCFPLLPDMVTSRATAKSDVYMLTTGTAGSIAYSGEDNAVCRLNLVLPFETFSALPISVRTDTISSLSSC